MSRVPPELAGHPDRQRWNSRYGAGFAPSFIPHPLAASALSMLALSMLAPPLQPPAGPVLDLASGPSGSALLAAAAGRQVTAVDVSEVALRLLGEEAGRRGLGELITLVHADLTAWRPQPGSYSLVLCTGYWDPAVFAAAAAAVRAGGLLAWEAFTAAAQRARPGLPAQWCLGPGEPAALLPASFDVLRHCDLPGSCDLPTKNPGTKRQLLARRRPS